VKIEVLKAGAVVQTITSSTPNDGSYNAGWTISPSLTTGTDYRIRITSTTNPAITDTSNNYLTLTPASGTITVTGGTPQDGVYIASYAFKYDGSDEVALLKTAIAAANAHTTKTLIFPAGKTISVGTAGVSDPLIELPRGVTLIGNGCEIKLRNNVHTNGVPWTFMKMQKGSNIYNLKLNGNDVGGNSHNTNGLYIMGGLNGGTQTIDGCEIHGFESYMLGVYANDGPPTNVYITNNKIYNSRQYGITTGCTDGSYCYGHNIVITGNTISDCDQVGVKVRGTYDSRIANNIIHVGHHVSDEPAGIRLYTWDEQNQNIVIENNIITGFDEYPSQGIKGDAPGQYGMTWDTGSRRMTIRNNQISHVNEGIVASLEGATITGNVLTSYAHSIDITPRSGGIANTITRNTCNGSPC
jgi:parallel beta-helix repeat protein